MHKAVRRKTLTGNVTAHVTPEEEKRIRERAAEVGLTKSEWCRQAILRSLETGAETRLLLAELLAIRKVFLALHVDVLQGQSLSEQRIRQVVEQAESTKFAMAESRIHAFRSHPSNE